MIAWQLDQIKLGKDTHPPQTTHPNKKSLLKFLPELFVQIVPPSFHSTKQEAGRNSLSKLFLVVLGGRGVVWGGLLSLHKTAISVRILPQDFSRNFCKNSYMI